jgi:hypothetical protein
MRKNRAAGTIFVGGLHKDDFEWASTEYEGLGYVLVAFELDCGGYHWKATYARIDPHEAPSRGRTTRLCLSKSLHYGEHRP